jgi:hypothetical protein
MPVQIVPKLLTAVMLDLERVLDNKPIRPPMISTLAMRWQDNIENSLQADKLMVTLETTESATSTSCGQIIGAKFSCNTLAFCIILWLYEMGFVGEILSTISLNKKVEIARRRRNVDHNR